jgi:glycogen debranching enzyme
LRRYRRVGEAARVIDGIFEAGVRMPNYRLPELFCGFKRDHLYNSGPTQYLVSCNPQAWGAGAAFQLLQTALGVVPDTTAGRLFLSPVPVAPLRQVEIDGMRVGNGRLSFAVTYDGGRPEVDIREQPEDLEVILDEPPLIT